MLVACNLAMCGLWTHPQTDVDPPHVKLLSAGAYRLTARQAFFCMAHLSRFGQRVIQQADYCVVGPQIFLWMLRNTAVPHSSALVVWSSPPKTVLSGDSVTVFESWPQRL